MSDRMTYRERRLAKAERLLDWADARDAKSTAAHQASHAATAGIPFGQPILVGHHSQRRHERALERSDNAMRSAIEHGDKAAQMRSRSEEIERQAATAIYSDDPDAIERLSEKIALLEAERQRIKTYNASCRREAKNGGTGDLTLLDEKQRESLLSAARVAAYMIGTGGSAPAYWSANLSGNIGRLRKRLAQLEREAQNGPRDRIITARFTSACELCGAELVKGQQIRYNRQAGARCLTCEGGEAA